MAGEVLIQTQGGVYTRARVTNTTDSSFPSRLPTFTAPTGIGDAAAQTTSSVWPLGWGTGGGTQNAVQVIPFGAGSNNNTLSVRVYAWRRVAPHGGDTNRLVWFPLLICELACTLSATVVGVAGGVVTSTDLFADTITLTTGSTSDVVVASSAGDVPGAYARVDFQGAEYLEFTFSTGSSATNCNCLWVLL